MVDAEIVRLRELWRVGIQASEPDASLSQYLTNDANAEIDLFDQWQPVAMITICRITKTLSEADQKLYVASRNTRSSTNDADRLRKYLARFGLSWQEVTGG